MTSADATPIQQTDQSVRRRWVRGFFVGALILLLSGLGNPPVNRTQEARVLETARQMLGTGAQGWLLPTLNGEPRLKKPPLAYWLSASAYSIAGVSEFVGRIPAALVGWLTLLAAFFIIERCSGWQIALASSATVLGSFHFFRYTRLAETDALAMLFLTVAIGAIWIAASDPRFRWHHLAAAATGFVILSKGAPAIFVFIFLIAFCASEKRWDVTLRFLKSGAPITLLIIAVPWFIYADQKLGGGAVFAGEISNTVRGGDHFRLPFDYIPQLFLASAPWSAFLPLAIFEAIRRWKTDSTMRTLLLWLSAILIPLCINGNKQPHYLVMLAPPMMILIAHLLMKWPDDLGNWVRWIFAGMLSLAFLGGFAIPMAAYFAIGEVRPGDIVVGVLLLIAATIVALVTTRRRHILAGIMTMMLAVCILMPVLIGYWIPSLTKTSSREVANQIRSAFGNGPYAYYGENRSLPLCFNLRAAIPGVETGKLDESTKPGTIVIAQTKNDTKPPPLPWNYPREMSIRTEDQTFDLYRRIEP